MQAFQAAWAAACKVEASTMMVPSKFKFFVGPISFSGPYCQQNIVFQVSFQLLGKVYRVVMYEFRLQSYKREVDDTGDR